MVKLELHEKQSRAFLTDATEVLYGGAAGGGKSHLFRVAAIGWSYAIPGLQTYVFRREYPDLWKNHMEGEGSFPQLLAQYIERGVVKFNQQRKVFEFWNGSKIHLCHCQYEKDVYGYQGAEIHVLMVDELTQWLRPMYTFLRSRMRLGGLKIPSQYQGQFPRALNGANPGGIGHNWVKADFIDIGPPFSSHKMPPKDGGLQRQFIPARLQDNPTLTENDPHYSDRLEGMENPALVRAMLDGDWNIVAGGMFDDVWNPDIHVVRPFEIPKTWRVDRSFDWGSSAPFSVGWWAESDGCDIEWPDGETKSTRKGDLFRIAEWYGWNGQANQGLRMTAAEIARGIVRLEKEMGVRVYPGPADTSIFDVENANSIAADMERAGIRWTRADKGPGTRKQGWQKLRERLRNAKSKEGPAMYAFETCSQFIRTVPVLPRGKDADDVDTASEDHVGDEVRYRLLTERGELQRVKLIGL